MPYKLFTTAYEEQHEARRKEYAECLAMNCRNCEVTVLAERMPRPEGFSCRWDIQSHRQTYSDLFAMAQTAEEDDIVIIANADIVIQGVAFMLIEEGIQHGQAFCLSRWDVLPQADGTVKRKLFDRVYSQDTWVFLGPPKKNIQGDFCLGCPGCDNRVAHELEAAGYQVLNPSRSIQTFHFHMSQHRTSNTTQNRVPGPYLFVSAHALGERPTYKRVPAHRVSRRASQFQT